MSNFKDFAYAVNKRLTQLSSRNGFYLADTPNLFDHYLNSFPPGTNEIFRERTTHDCNCCKQFIRNLGRMVVIEDGVPLTVWQDLGPLPYPYDAVAEAMHQAVSSSPILSIFATSETRFGKSQTIEQNEAGLISWDHFYGDVPRAARSSSPGRDIGRASETFAMLKNALTNFRAEDVSDVLDLIDDDCLYRGQEFRNQLTSFRELMIGYTASGSSELFIWESIGHSAARIKNSVIGTLLSDLADKIPLENAKHAFERKMDPNNYRRPTAAITSRMVEKAATKLEELGLQDSIQRRFANVGDISVADIIFVDNSVADKTKDGIRDLLLPEVKYADNGKAQEIGIEEFLALGKGKVQVVLEQDHFPNFVSLTAPVNPESPSLFAWQNGFAWSYDGEVADSIKERVKKAGGNVNAKLRCSLSWHSHSDLDLHCDDPARGHVCYANKAGILDVDMNAGCGPYSYNPVENLSWGDRDLSDGTYGVYVHNFCRRGCSGFEIEVESGGQLNQFRSKRDLPNGERVYAVSICVQGGQVVKIEPGAGMAVSTSSYSSSEKWGIKTNVPVTVNMIMLSPNHWENSSKTGNKHYFFFLDGCVNPEPTRGIYNEFLKGSLNEHRKVFEALGRKTKCEPTPNQLSGVGFSSTSPNRVKMILDGKPFMVKF